MCSHIQEAEKPDNPKQPRKPKKNEKPREGLFPKATNGQEGSNGVGGHLRRVNLLDGHGIPIYG